ncbi:MAG: hypothetical protein KKF24_01220, partial [Gammaproteobacteria bacterium]|nr:hypothetical protein [Gammaproteobacteria bacterium]MBU1831292.1 hypothetical protein [Gammaproteobacteria bacterium]
MKIPGDNLGNATPNPQRGSANGNITGGIDAIGQLANIGADLAGQVVKNQRALDVAQATTEASMELENYVYDIKNNDRDYGTQFDRYTQFSTDLDKRYKDRFKSDPAGYSVFRTNLGELAFKKGFDVRSHSIGGQIDQQKGQLDRNMATMSELAIQGDDEQREIVKTKGQLLLQEAYDNGVVNGVERVNLEQKFQDDMVSGQVRKDILDNPDMAATNLLEGKYQGLSGEQQMIWLEKANSRSEAKQRALIAEQDRDRREQDRLEKDAANNMAKAGDKLLFSGGLTADWLEENRDTLDEQDYRYFYKAMATGSESYTDTGIYSDLRFRASNGEDVRLDARAALRRNQLKLADYDKLMNRSEKNSGVGELPSWFKRGEDFLKNTFAVSDINPDPADSQRRAVVLDEWNQWANENKNPSMEEANKAFREIAQSYALVDSSDMLVLKPLPKFSVGGRQKMDIEG